MSVSPSAYILCQILLSELQLRLTMGSTLKLSIKLNFG
jgi:hypothetical protein